MNMDIAARTPHGCKVWPGLAGLKPVKGQGVILQLVEFCDGLGSGTDMELLVDALNVGANGRVADLEMIGNFLVEKAFGQAVEYFCFTRR